MLMNKLIKKQTSYVLTAVCYETKFEVAQQKIIKKYMFVNLSKLIFFLIAKLYWSHDYKNIIDSIFYL